MPMFSLCHQAQDGTWAPSHPLQPLPPLWTPGADPGPVISNQSPHLESDSQEAARHLLAHPPHGFSSLSAWSF
jgi:hypothetical protein